MNRFVQYIVISLIAFAVTGCQDDFLNEERIGKGNAAPMS